MELKERYLKVLDDRLKKKIPDDDVRWQTVLQLEAFADILITLYLEQSKKDEDYER